MPALSRRVFLKSGAATATLAIALSGTPFVLAQETAAADGHATPCLRIDENGGIILCAPIPDMGQGIMTAAAQIIAEELDINLDAVTVEFMPFIGTVNSNGFAQEGELAQSAGGSQSTMLLWSPLRKTAAYARALLVQAAADKWKIPASSLSTRDGHVIDAAGNRKIPYADLFAAIQNVQLDKTTIQPKNAAAYNVIGKDARNVASYDIVTGKPVFSLDVDVPGMLHAAIRRCPHLNGKLVSFNQSDIQAMPGVKAVHKIDRVIEDDGFRILSDSVAVIADTYWHARKAADALEAVWDGDLAKGDTTDTLLSECRNLLQGDNLKQVAKKGNPESIINQASQTIDVTYTHPSWAHACIEPHNCIAHVQGDSADIWVGHQNMVRPSNIAKKFASVDPAKVKGHFYRLGTGFGRKYVEDYTAEALILSKRMNAPVKVTWSREDEMEQDYPNHMGAYRIRAALDDNGDLAAWHIRTALDTGRDWVARDFPTTAADHALGEVATVPNHISRGAWRGPSHNTGAWVVQSALSEAAYAAGRDPYDFLVTLYKKAGTIKTPDWPNRDVDYTRHAALLEKVAKESGYGKKMPEGWGQGIAVHHTFVSACAHVVDLEMIGDNDYRVHKVTSAIDCGLAVNPLGVRAQVESGIMDGLCAAKYGNFLFEAGVPVTNNFDTYQKMRIDEAPAEVNIFIMDFGDTEPRGTGEVSLPPVIPALTNAIFAASGKRIRELPISKNL